MAKIFLLIDDPRINTGYSATNRITIRHLSRLGHECIAFSFNSGYSEGFYENCRILNTPKNSDNENERLYGNRDFLIRSYNEFKPDLLFFHNDFYRQAWFLSLPEEIQKKSVWWIPIDILRKDQAIDFSYFKMIQNLYFVTNYSAEIIGINNPKVIPHAVDDSYFDLNRSEKIHKDKFVICRVDRHQPRKQWPYALEAYSLFSKNKSDVHFIAKCNPKDQTGFDPDTKDFIDLEEFRDRVRINPEKIEFVTEFTSVKDIINDIYDQSDVFFSVSGSEGFGLGVIESMARGCIPVVPNGSVFPEVTGNNGYFFNYKEIRRTPVLNVEYGRPDSLHAAEKLEQAYRQWKHGELEDISDRCQNHARMFHPSVIYGKWNKEIERICKNNIEISTKPDYSIIIVSKDKFGMLKECLSSIIYNTQKSYEIIIVNNCGTPETKDLLEDYKILCSDINIKLIHNDSEKEFTYANNLGVKISEGKYVVLLNNDTIIESEKWLLIPREQLEEEKADLIGPSKCWMNLSSSLEEIPESLRNMKVVYYDDQSKMYRCDFTGYWFVMAKRELFEEIPLNEDIKSYLFDDVDHCLQISEKGKKWTWLKGEHESCKNLIKHLREQSRDFLSPDSNLKASKEFFDSWKNKEKIRITVTIPTRNRENCLRQLLISLLNQSYSEWDLIVCNDGDDFTIETNQIIDLIIKYRKRVKIIKGLKKGPARAHNEMFRHSETEWIYRIDDDNIMDKECLRHLSDVIRDKGTRLGAVAPMVISPFDPLDKSVIKSDPPEITGNNFLSAATVQQHFWPNSPDIISAEHLHSSFVYRKSFAEKTGFIYHENDESIVSYGEETIFTYKIFLSGYKLYVCQNAYIWHFISQKGGTRDDGKYSESVMKDFEIYKNTMNELMNKNKSDLKSQDSALYDEIFTQNSYKINRNETEGKNVIDVGANLGFFSILCAEYGAEKIISIEINPETFKKLENNVKKYDNILPYNYAVINSKYDKVGWAGEHVKCHPIIDGNIQVVSLKDLLFENDDNIILKIDAEGSEYDILFSEDMKTLRRFKYIFIEIHEGNLDLSIERNEIKNINNLENYIKFVGFKILEKNQMYWFTMKDGQVVNSNPLPAVIYKFERID
jgi:FkbM family methyltransferase